MRLLGMTKSRNSLLDGVAMTAMERRVGRFMRAPDHDAGTPAADLPAADPAPAPDAVPAVDPVAAADDGDVTALGGKLPDPDAAAADPVADDAPPAPVIPEAYELTAPEGMTLDADLLAEATPIFKEMGLTNEAANKVLPIAKTLMDKTRDATVQQLIDQGAQQRKAWLDEAKADPEIGGAKWDNTLHAASRALDALGHVEGSPLRVLLNETGIGNHPAMIGAMAQIGAMVGEDGAFVRSDAGAKVTAPLEERLYPNG